MAIKIESTNSGKKYRKPKKRYNNYSDQENKNSNKVMDYNYGYKSIVGGIEAVVGTIFLFAAFSPKYKEIANYCYGITVGLYSLAIYSFAKAGIDLDKFIKSEQKKKKSLDNLSE